MRFGSQSKDSFSRWRLVPNSTTGVLAAQWASKPRTVAMAYTRDDTGFTGAIIVLFIVQAIGEGFLE